MNINGNTYAGRLCIENMKYVCHLKTNDRQHRAWAELVSPRWSQLMQREAKAMHLCQTLRIPRSGPKCADPRRCCLTNDLLSLMWRIGRFMQRKMLIKGSLGCISALLSCHSLSKFEATLIATRFYIFANEFVNLFGKWMSLKLACWTNSILSPGDVFMMSFSEFSGWVTVCHWQR